MKECGGSKRAGVKAARTNKRVIYYDNKGDAPVPQTDCRTDGTGLKK